MYSTRLILPILVVIIGAGCGSEATPSADQEAILEAALAADRDAILEQSRSLSEAYMAGDIATLVAIYTDDGVAVPGNRDFVQGHDALTRLWTLPEGRTILRHVATPRTLKIDGDHAYDWGYFEGQAAQDGEPMNVFRGAYVIVWERGDDGQWRIAADMWNSLPNLPE